MAKDISIIVTTYNSAGTIARALSSVLQGGYGSRFEVIVIDDCSDDGTWEILNEYRREYGGVELVRMPENTGSPSLPRNAGISLARADYLTFLDGDDYIDAGRLVNMVEYARRRGYDYLKGYLRIDRGGAYSDAGVIDNPGGDRTQLIRQMIAQQSTNADMIVRREFLLASGVLFDAGVRTGEDTLFVTALLASASSVGYVHEFFHYYCVRADAANRSTTQTYGDRALRDHLRAWSGAEENLNRIGLSYYELRLPFALRYSFQSVVSFSRGGISEPCFREFSAFVRAQRKHASRVALHRRHRAILRALLRGSYSDFQKAAKRRLLIAGHGASALLPAFSGLSGQYDIRCDEWPAGASRGGFKSGRLADWADFVWCAGEAPAKWHSGRKLGHQTLVMHAGGRPDGAALLSACGGKVDAYAVSGYYILNELKELGLPEEKLSIAGFAAENDRYGDPKGADYRYGIALLCSLDEADARSAAEDLVRGLKKADARFGLKGSGGEGAGIRVCLCAGEECERAAAAAVAAGAPALLIRAPGREYLFPPSMLCESAEEMRGVIERACSREEDYNALLDEQRRFVLEEYSLEAFAARAGALLERARLGSA